MPTKELMLLRDARIERLNRERKELDAKVEGGGVPLDENTIEQMSREAMYFMGSDGGNGQAEVKRIRG